MARRSGGRNARVALRTAKPAAEDRAVRPGMSGGKLRILTDSELEAVFETSLGLLEDLGMGQATPEFIDLVTGAGGRVGGLRPAVGSRRLRGL